MGTLNVQQNTARLTFNPGTHRASWRLLKTSDKRRHESEFSLCKSTELRRCFENWSFSEKTNQRGSGVPMTAGIVTVSRTHILLPNDLETVKKLVRKKKKKDVIGNVIFANLS